MGLEEAPIRLYLLVDDIYRVVTFGGWLRQHGPGLKLSDVEVLTMEFFGDQQGRHDDASIHRYFDGVSRSSRSRRAVPGPNPSSSRG